MRRLVEVRVHACDSGHVDNGLPAHALPYIRPDDDAAEDMCIREEWHGVPGQIADEDIHQAVGFGQKGETHAINDNPGEKVRHIGQRLHAAAQLDAVTFIEQNRQQQRNGDRQQDFAQADDERVGQQLRKIIGFKEELEVAVPWIQQLAASKSLAQIVLDHTGCHAQHNRGIFVDDIIDKPRQEHQEKGTLLPQLSQQRMALLLHALHHISHLASIIA